MGGTWWGVSEMRRSWRWVVVGGGVVLAVAGLWAVRQRAAPLTAERLAEARRLWAAGGPADYALEVETGGAIEARHRVVVRGGEVVEMTTGGAAASRSAWEFWTVEGLFAFLETELANADQPRAAYGPGAGAVVLRARFDRRDGHPTYFLRHVMGQRRSVELRVARFQRPPAGPG